MPVGGGMGAASRPGCGVGSPRAANRPGGAGPERRTRPIPPRDPEPPAPMTSSRRWLPAILLVALALRRLRERAGSNGRALADHRATRAVDDAPPTERPFAPIAWPADGSACAIDGYEGRLGRVEAVGPRTVRFTLCSPTVRSRPGWHTRAWASSTRWAWAPSRRTRSRRAPSPGPAGSGSRRGRTTGTCASPGSVGPRPVGRRARRPPPLRRRRRSPGRPRRRVESAAPASPPPPVIVLRWATSPAERSAALREATVDGIDAPAPADAADMATLPELVVLPRPGLETAYLGFGAGRSLSQTGVRRAFAQALDQAAIARDAFPPGSAPATHTTPCEVPAGCAGPPGTSSTGRRHPPRWTPRSSTGRCPSSSTCPTRRCRACQPRPRRPPPCGTSWRQASASPWRST